MTRLDGTVFLSEFVFHRGDGGPIGDFKRSWRAACAKAGMPGVLFHDFRRSAARNLRRSGIAPDVGMQITARDALDVAALLDHHGR